MTNAYFLRRAVSSAEWYFADVFTVAFPSIPCRVPRMGTSSDPVAILAAIRARNPHFRKVRVTAAIPAGALAMALRDSGETRELVLSGVHYSRPELCQILEALSLGSSLRVLDLSVSALDEDTLFDVADLVRHSTSLARLDLSGNDVPPDAAEELGDALRDHGSMRTLILRDVDLRDDGVEALLCGLADASPLHKLVVSDNAITDQGCAMLSAFARKSTQITTLVVGGNSLPVDVAEAIAASCARNVTRLGYNPASRPASMIASRQGGAASRPGAPQGRLPPPSAIPSSAALPELGTLLRVDPDVVLPSLTLLVRCEAA